MPNKNDPQHLYSPDDLDFRLRPGSVTAIDAGIALPTITDDFTGKAPDLGAYEFDRPPPTYGPRPPGPRKPHRGRQEPRKCGDCDHRLEPSEPSSASI